MQLKPHPDFPHPATTGIDVSVIRTAFGALQLRYLLTGTIDDLAVPARAATARADELWKHTCFEAFVRPVMSEAYCELNFSPSTQWAAYRFSDYRKGMAPIAELRPPIVSVSAGQTQLEVQVEILLDGLAELPLQESWRIGLSAVIEATDGSKSYWALVHPQGKPDFHAGETLELILPAEPT